MNEVMSCPVTGAVDRPAGMEGLGEYRRQTAQELVYWPGSTDNIMEPAEEHVTDYFAPVTQHNPTLGEFKIARTLRNIVMSAAYFNGVTFYMNRFASELAARNAKPDEKEPITLTDYLDPPLPQLDVFRFKTDRCQRFVTELGSVLFGWGEVGILDPDSESEPLAQAVRELDERFVEAESRHLGTAPSYTTMDEFIKNGSEDNAHAILHTLIGLGGLSLYESGGPVSPAELALQAISEQQVLSDLSSVIRPFSQAHIRPMTEADWRAPDVIDYEAAVLGGIPMPRASTAPYFMTVNGRVRSSHPSLAKGPWRESGMCAGSPKLAADTVKKNLGNQVFFLEAVRYVGRLAEAEDDMLIYPPSRRVRSAFSSVEAGLNFGILAALPTIYQDFPQVKDI